MKKRIVSAVICVGFLVVLAAARFSGGVPAVPDRQAEVSENTPAAAVSEEDLVDDFEESVTVDGALVQEPEVPLAPNAKSDTKVVTSKPKVTTQKSKGKLKKASKTSKTVTKKTTHKEKKSTINKINTVVKETTTVTTKKTIYKKGSRVTNITTKISTTVKTSTTPIKVEIGDIHTVAKKADPRLLERFDAEGYDYVVDTGLEYIGLFSSRSRQITMRYQSDVVYHELGHYLAYTTGRTDLTDEWAEIYEAEADKFDGDNKAYVTSTCREYFAETYRDYITRRSALKSKRPQSCAYIEKILEML